MVRWQTGPQQGIKRIHTEKNMTCSCPAECPANTNQQLMPAKISETVMNPVQQSIKVLTDKQPMRRSNNESVRIMSRVK